MSSYYHSCINFIPSSMSSLFIYKMMVRNENGYPCTVFPEIPDDAILTCEFCHKADVARKFRRSKRFCSVPCAKRYNVGCSRRVKPVHLLANYVSG